MIKWKEIPNNENYYASKEGFIKGPSGKILNPLVTKSGHFYVFINRRKKYVHRIILETFISECPEKMECRHLDGNPKNNNINNLVWGTKKENVNDRRIHGRMPIPHLSIFTKLKPNDIPKIIEFHELNLSSRKIAKKFNTSHTTIQKIIRGERWKGYV